MVSLGFSTSQCWLIAVAVISLLVLLALLWMNGRTPAKVRPVVVLAGNGVQYPADSVSRTAQAFALRLPARAPPTIVSLPISIQLDAPDPDPILRARPIADSAESFR